MRLGGVPPRLAPCPVHVRPCPPYARWISARRRNYEKGVLLSPNLLERSCQKSGRQMEDEEVFFFSIDYNTQDEVESSSDCDTFARLLTCRS